MKFPKKILIFQKQRILNICDFFKLKIHGTQRERERERVRKKTRRGRDTDTERQSEMVG